MKQLKIGDIILILFIIALTVFLLFLNTNKGEKVVVEVNGEIIKTFNLSVDDSFIYDGKYKNTITVKDGKVFVSESNCPDKTCVNSGGIDTGIICCLPNKLIIRVVESDKNVDVISG